MIYFMQATDGGPIKIGFTENVAVRRRQLEAHYGRTLAILATMEGDREREAEIHNQFREHRLGKTEQFRPVPELMEFIGVPLLVGANSLVVEVMATKTTMLRVSDDFAEAMRDAASFEKVSIAEFADTHLLAIVRKRYREAVIREAKRMEGKP